MNKRKLILYIIIIAIFLCFSMFYIWTLLQSTRDMYALQLKDNITSTETQIEKGYELQAKDLMYEFNRFGIVPDKNNADFLGVLQNIEGYLGHRLEFADEKGTIYDTSGKPTGRVLKAQSIRKIQNSGYSVDRFHNEETGVNNVLLSVPLAFVLPNYYLIETYNMDEFAANIYDNITFSTSTISIFDEWGTSIHEYSRGERTVSDGELLEIDSYLANPANNVLSNGLFSDNYHVFISLSQPYGWTIGSHANINGTGHYFTKVISSSVIMLIAWTFLVLIVIILDIVNDREKKKELFLVTSRDQLTGLINSVGMKEIMTDYMENHTMKGYSFVCLDIVAFSRLNRMFGYHMGDMLLNIISRTITENYFCGVRTNADNFAFLAISADALADDIQDRLFKAIETDFGAEYLQMVSFKLGIYPITEPHPVYQDVYDGALLALKNAKQTPKQTQVVYDNAFQDSMDMRKNIEINMMHALSKDEFLVYIQPQYSLHREEYVRGEALIRWQSEFMGLLPPDKFIPIFENNGFIVETDFFMLQSAFELLQSRYDKGEKLMAIAVNQSKVTISFPNYFERLKNLVEQFSLPLKYIELEITESTLENDWETIVPLLHNIKKLGFNISMDDFGSGFSSLNTLRMLPIDVLKIDRAFLQESDVSGRSRTIICNVIKMAKELNIQIVCEGVETEKQFEFLKTAGCDIIQGYYLSRPIPIEEFVSKYLDK